MTNTTSGPQRRGIYWVEIVGVVHTKQRVCVVIEVTSSHALVVYGQGTSAHGFDHVEVCSIDPDYRRMGLSKTTYFREGNVVVLPLSELRNRVGTCTNDLMARIDELAEVADKKYGTRNQLRQFNHQVVVSLSPPPTKLQSQPGVQRLTDLESDVSSSVRMSASAAPIKTDE